MENLRKQAINFFATHSRYSVEKIKNIYPIHSGYTNHSFCVVVTNNKKYQIRMANQLDIMKRSNEYNVLKKIRDKYYVFFEKNTGNAIKTWIDGTHPTNEIINSKLFLKKLSHEIYKIHKKRSIEHIEKNNYLDCLDKAKKHLPKKHLKWYCELINKYKNLDLVLSHNDLSAQNMLWTKNKKIIFIDYEWARRNNQYWDLANFVKETDLSQDSVKYLLKINKHLNKEIFKHFIYIAINYALQWTYNMPKTEQIIEYRKKLKLQLENFSDQYKYL